MILPLKCKALETEASITLSYFTFYSINNKIKILFYFQFLENLFQTNDLLYLSKNCFNWKPCFTLNGLPNWAPLIAN